MTGKARYVVAAVLLGLGIVAAAGVRRDGLPRRAPLASPPAASTPVAGPPDLRAVMEVLDRARVAAYAAPVDGDPDAWAAPGCACRAEEARRLRALAASGLALRGVTVSVEAVRVRALSADVAEVVVTDRLAPYVAVDEHGRVRARYPGRGVRRWRIRLVWVDDRWLIGALARAP